MFNPKLKFWKALTCHVSRPPRRLSIYYLAYITKKNKSGSYFFDNTKKHGCCFYLNVWQKLVWKISTLHAILDSFITLEGFPIEKWLIFPLKKELFWSLHPLHPSNGEPELPHKFATYISSSLAWNQGQRPPSHLRASSIIPNIWEGWPIHVLKMPITQLLTCILLRFQGVLRSSIKVSLKVRVWFAKKRKIY